MLAALTLGLASAPASASQSLPSVTNGKIVFGSDLGTRGGYYSSTDIYVMNPDGSGLTRFAADGSEGSPVWSPDGTKILFGRGCVNGFCNPADGGMGMFVMNADGTGATKIPGTGWVASDPTGGSADWNQTNDGIVYPTAQAIPFSCGSGFSATRMVYIDLAGTKGSYLPCVDASLKVSQPDLSDAGIVFSDTQAGTSSIIRSVGLDDTALTSLTSPVTDRFDIQPEWSPDGTQIVFSRMHNLTQFDGIADLIVMNADGSGVHTLFADGEVNTDPSWSPDGQTIVFVRYDTEAYGQRHQIATINVDGSGLTQLTHSVSSPMAETART